MSRILLIEDHEELAKPLQRSLQKAGYETLVAPSALEGLRGLRDFKPQLIILDLGLPDMDGMEVCEKVRGFSKIPILMMTARGSLHERVEGLETGADDYLVKPVEREELLARVGALLRRVPSDPAREIGPLKVDPTSREASIKGMPIALTKTEFDLLLYLSERSGQVVTREEIQAHLWPEEERSLDTIKIFVNNLRNKLEEDGDERVLHTKHGQGYILKANG